MKPGLSLRVSQHLALTPQLQQSIRLLQLSTLELAQEIEHMLQDNPFLEQEAPEVGYEEALALERAQRSEELIVREAQEERLDAMHSVANNLDSTWADDGFDLKFEATDGLPVQTTAERSATQETADAADLGDSAQAGEPSDWDGDGSASLDANDSEWGVEAASRNANANESDDNPAERNASNPSLQEHLHEQARMLRISPEDGAVLYMLIESLGDDGYLEDDFETLAASLGVRSLEDTEELIARFGIALKWLQRMEPTGVGARHLAECLLLQLRDYEEDWGMGNITQAARAILGQPLELLAKRDFKRLASLCQFTAQEVKQAMALIASFEPKPARRFAQVERNIVVPDVIVRCEMRRGTQRFLAQINPAVMPRLMVNDLYANALKTSAQGTKKSEAAQGLQTRLQEARWFVKNVQQRFDTILRVSQAIVERQNSFFKHGAVGMRPLVLREIADEIGMHESTISRVTTAKYMSTPWGTFELKYFFGSALTTETGGIASSTAVRELIKQFIEAENKAKPLSDNAIGDMLKEQGIECARRTVAKYREAMRIPVTSLRKTL